MRRFVSFLPVLLGLLLSACATQSSRGEFNSAVSAELPLLISARVEPVKTQGRLTALRLLEIEPGSFWEKAGFREADEVTAINGRPVRTEEDYYRLLATLAVPSSAQVQIERRSETNAPAHVEILRVGPALAR